MPARLAAAFGLVFASQVAAGGLPPPGAASCTGCHASRTAVQSPGPRLAGEKRDKLLAALSEFRRGERPATVMDRLVRGFSDEELQAIAAWFAEQK